MRGANGRIESVRAITGRARRNTSRHVSAFSAKTITITTAIIAGKNGGIGIALAEIYNLK
jgi:hypothetical protein